MTTGCTVCVCGFPAELPPERVADKLTVYFLRARNGGGEIANIEFAPGSPECAMVTFEEASVAQQILKNEKHTLTIGEKSYPLQVSPYTPDLNPNEIFVDVYIKIDYGRIPGGKEVLRSLCKQYGDVVVKFHSQEMTCIAKGPFTEMQVFSSELLRSFQSKQRNSTLDRRKPADKVGGDETTLLSVLKIQGEKKSKKAATEGPPPRNPPGNHTEQLEDFSVVVDSDIYLYMQTFCQKELSSIRRQHKVDLVNVTSEGVVTLYLQAASKKAQGIRALASAHLAISQFSQQLEATLRKEKISQRDLGGADEVEQLLKELQSLCPFLLLQLDEEHLCLIGDMVEVSQAKQYIQGFIAARKVKWDPQKLAVSQAESMPQLHGESPASFQHVPSAEFLPRKWSCSRWSRGKTECKLATRFSASDSRASLPSFSSQDTPLGGLLTGDFSQRTDYHTAEIRNHMLQGPLAVDLKSQVEQSLAMKAHTPATRLRSPQLSLDACRSFGPEHPSPFWASSSALRSSNLFDSVETVDPKVTDLRRPSSSLLAKLKNSSNSIDESSPVARSNMDHLQSPSWEESHYILQQDISQKADCQITKPCFLRSTSLGVQRDGVSQAGPSIVQEVGVFAKPPDLIYEQFSYSELAMEGPEDEAFADLCTSLKACHDRVAVSQGRSHLGLCYPQEVKQQVLETLHYFSARRLSALTEQLLSRVQQKSRSVQLEMQQEDIPKTEIQKSPQQTGEASTAGLVEHPPHHLSSLAGENLSSQVERFLAASPPAVRQNFPSDGRARPSRKLAHAPVASEQGCSGGPATEAPQRFLGKFPLARDSNKENCHCDVEGASRPEPILVMGFPTSGSKGCHWTEDSHEEAPRSFAGPALQQILSSHPAVQPARQSLDTWLLQPRQSSSRGISKIWPSE